jgi:hypothetical protein
MIRVVIEVTNGAARFDVAVQAEDIQQSVSLVAARYPASVVGVKFPIEPERFFVKDFSEPIGHEQLEKAAA